MIERLYREARPMRIYEGATEVHPRLAVQTAAEEAAVVIVDAHCHVWPDHIAPKVLANRPAGMDARHDGTLSGLTRTLDAAGIDKAMTLAIAGVPKNVARTNEFIGTVPRDRFIPFGTVHPGLSIEDNLVSLRDNGIRRGEAAPAVPGPFAWRPGRTRPAAGAGGGRRHGHHARRRRRGRGRNERGAPEHLRAIIDAIPSLRLIACHYGGYHCIDEAEELVVGGRG